VLPEWIIKGFEIWQANLLLVVSNNSLIERVAAVAEDLSHP